MLTCFHVLTGTWSLPAYVHCLHMYVAFKYPSPVFVTCTRVCALMVHLPSCANKGLQKSLL